MSATFFYKDLKNYVYTQNQLRDFADVPNPSNVLEPASTEGVFSQPANGHGGYMRGQEYAVSMPLDILWQPLDGFGVQLAYAKTSSGINPNGPGTPMSPFPGLSKYVSQATLYYENYGFSARIAATHRSDFHGEVQAFGADQEFHNVQAETVTDLQLGYMVQTGMLEGLNIIFQVQNLFDEPYREYYGTRAAPRLYTVYGRQYLLGANFRF